MIGSKLLRRFLSNDDGITVVEFAIIAPVFILMLMGMMDLAHTAYVKSILTGAVKEAAREASLEGGDSASVDKMVTDMIKHVAISAEVQTQRTSYFDFADIDRPETWDDDDDSGQCDNGEGYVDENNNGQWDLDIGQSGNGGASDVVLYTANVVYVRPFAMPLLPGGPQNTLTVTALRKNQPFADQAAYNVSAATCD